MADSHGDRRLGRPAGLVGRGLHGRRRAPSRARSASWPGHEPLLAILAAGEVRVTPATAAPRSRRRPTTASSRSRTTPSRSSRATPRWSRSVTSAEEQAVPLPSAGSGGACRPPSRPTSAPAPRSRARPAAAVRDEARGGAAGRRLDLGPSLPGLTATRRTDRARRAARSPRPRPRCARLKLGPASSPARWSGTAR